MGAAGRHVFSPGWPWPGPAGTWMLQFLTLSWNVEEKAFDLLGEPQVCLPALTATEWGCLRTWRCKSLELVLEPVEEQLCVHSSCRQGPTLSLQGQVTGCDSCGIWPREERSPQYQVKVQRAQCPQSICLSRGQQGHLRLIRASSCCRCSWIPKGTVGVHIASVST